MRRREGLVSRNVTIRIDEDILKKCKFAAVEEDMSLSKWISFHLERIIRHRESYLKARDRAVKRLETGFHLKDDPLKRDEIYDRQ